MTKQPERENRPVCRPWRSVALLYTLVIVAIFFPWWGQGYVFAPLDILNEMYLPYRGENLLPTVKNQMTSDAVTQYIPYHLLAAESLAKDGYIGWNPYGRTGLPFHANTMALPGDWTLALYRVFSFWTGWHLGLMLQLLIAGWGMLALLHHRRCNPWAALIGSLAFAGNYQFVVWFFHRWALGSFCWMPWIFLFLFRWREGKPGSLPLATGFLALAYLGGSLQHVAIVIASIACFWAGEIVFSKASFIGKVKGTLTLLGIGLGALLIASPVLLPCIQVLSETMSDPTYGRTSHFLRQGWMQIPLYLSTYVASLFPSPLGAPQTLDCWRIFKSYLFALQWYGTLPTLLGLLSLFLRSIPLTARLLIATALIVPLTPLETYLYRRILLLFAFGGAWAAAEYFTHASPEARQKLGRLGGLCTGAVALLWSAGSVVLLWLSPTVRTKAHAFVQSRLSESQFGLFSDWFRDRTDAYVDSLFIWSNLQWPLVLLALSGFVVVYLAAKRRWSPALWQGAIAVLLGCELFIMAYRWITVVDPAKHPLYAETEEAEALRRLAGQNRIEILGNKPARQIFPSNVGSPHRLSFFRIYESAFSPSPFFPDLASYAALGVSHLCLPKGETPPEGCIKVWEGKVSAIFEIPFPPQRLLVFKNAGDPASSAPFELVSPNRMRLTIPQGITQFELRDQWSPNWHARRLDTEQPVKLLPHPLGITATLEPSAHPFTIELTYDPGFGARFPWLPPLLLIGAGAAWALVRSRSIPNPSEARSKLTSTGIA